ncbi:NUDIX hydrolase [Spirochaeta cellobiosiphila]|uniref:NUDIX hydrolase n=1 Tax=Spirochaeta cellobiosiphila TaxID=504483 RepID=UPI0003FC6DD2|nr:CoA pyrophosphatase [Spirochaeta cellobiosiphila]
MSNEQYKGLLSRLTGRPGIVGHQELKHSCVLVPFLFEDGMAKILFEKRAFSIRQGGEISFPGGMVEQGEFENTADTALRETMEELNLDSSKIVIDGRFDSLITPAGYMVDIYIGRLLVPRVSDINPSPSEVESVFTIPVGELISHEPEEYKIRVTAHAKDQEGNEIFPAKELDVPDRYWSHWELERQPIYLYKTDYGPIWGITARIIREVLKNWPVS